MSVIRAFFFSAAVAMSFAASAQAPDISWQACSGKYEADLGSSIVELKNGNYLVAGTSWLATGHKGGGDYWLVELDKGTVVWEKNYGGSKQDECYDITETKDGGFILVGRSESQDADITNPKGKMDCWVVKLDADRNIIWQRSLGGSFVEFGSKAVATDDGGCLVGASTRSNDGDVTGMHGYEDIWLVKLDVQGNIEWQKCYGGTGSDLLGDVAPVANGGYVIAGSTSPQPASMKSIYQAWAIKVNDTGAVEWQKTYGGSSNDLGRSIKQTDEGGYIFLASTSSKDGDVAAFKDTTDIWLVKLDDTGKIQWQKTFGGTDVERANTVETTDDGYVILGNTISTDGDIIGNHGLFDMWVIKTYKNGQVEWRMMLGGSRDETAGQLIRNSAGGYAIVGNTQSIDGDVANPLAADDYWTIVLNQFPSGTASPTIGQIKLYPTVNNGKFYIEMDNSSKTSVTVNDVLGHTVPAEVIKEPKCLTVRLLTDVPGTYFVAVNAGSQLTAYKVLVDK